MIKFRSAASGALLTMAAIFSAHVANATPLPVLYSGESGNLGNNWTAKGNTEPNTSIFTGSLPTDEKVTFTYSFNNLSLGGSLELQTPDGNAQSPYSTPLIVPGLLVASANLPANSVGTTTGTTSLTNISGSSLSFKTIFAGIFSRAAANDLSVSFVVSSVPLPATLLMFGSAVLAMFGMGWRKRNSAEA